MNNSYPRMIKLGSIILLVVALAFLIGNGRSPGGSAPGLMQTYQSPYSFHNFDYNYDFEYGFTAPNETEHLSAVKKNIIIAAVVPNQTDAETLCFIEGMRQEAKREQVGLVVLDAQGNPEQQSALILRALEDGMNAFILFPIAGSSPGQEVRRLKRENRPVISVWGRTDSSAVTMIDAFVGMNSEEFGRQIAAWVVQLDGNKRSVVLVTREEQSALAESFFSRLHIYGKDMVSYQAGADTLRKTVDEAIDNGGTVQIICTDPELAHLAAEQFSHTEAVTLLGAGEEAEISKLIADGVITGGLTYSRQREGAAAIAAAAGIVRGKSASIRLESMTALMPGGAK